MENDKQHRDGYDETVVDVSGRSRYTLSMTELLPPGTGLPAVVPPASMLAGSPPLPAIVAFAGEAGQFAWDEFFLGRIRNAHTRSAYAHAVRRFLDWCEQQHLTLPRITPGHVGQYFGQHPGSIPTRKLHLAALRAFFDLLTERHVVVLNPAACVRGERYETIEGKTPEITPEQARALLKSIDTKTVTGLRDRAIVATLIYTLARAGAVAALKRKHLIEDSTQFILRFAEKGGKSREIPVRHNLQEDLQSYLALLPDDESDNAPLFRTVRGRSKKLTQCGLSGIAICRMVQRRLKDAGLPARLSPHSFRVCGVTDLLEQGVALEDVQHLAGHADPRTTRLYDRRQKKITRNIVERISV